MNQTTDGDQEPHRLNPGSPRQFFKSGHEADFFVFVVCTDRGQHKRVLLTTARRELGGGHGMNNALKNFAPPDPDAKPGSAFGRDAYIFTCPRCPRTPHINQARWWEIIDELGRRGVGELDLSMLPF